MAPPRAAAGAAAASAAPCWPPSGPLLLVDDHGWVAHQAGIAARDRIEVPRDARRSPCRGSGCALPSGSARAGWSARRGRAGHRADLDLTGPPVLDVAAPRAWRTPLTPRHAEILLLLHRAGRAGMTAAH